jgi:hypothetical protein
VTTTKQERTAKAAKKAAVRAREIITEIHERTLAERAQEAIDSENEARAKAAKRCPVCKTTGTVAELKAGGHGKACSAKCIDCIKPMRDCTCPSTPQTDAKPTKAATPTKVVRKAASTHSVDQGAKCVEMREQGSSWMAIGAALGLPGAKTGAAAARKLYAAHTGQSHTQAPSPARKPRASKRHPAQVGSKTGRREVVQQRGGFFSADMTDEEVVALVHGKTIEWSIDLARLAGGKGEPQWCDQEARVHPTDVYVREDGGERVLNFRTLEGWGEADPKTGDSAPLAGPTRTVRLAAIHTVR